MDAVTQDDARAALRSAIEVRQRAYERHQKAKIAHARCAEALGAVEADVAALGDVDGEAAAFRAGRIREQLDGGATVVAVATLPHELSAKIRARDALQAHAAAVRSTRSQLGAELAEAERDFAVSSSAVEVAALDVLLARACEMAREMARAGWRVCQLYDAISALGECWFRTPAGPPRPAPLGVDVVGELQLASVLAASDVRHRSTPPRTPGMPDPLAAGWKEAHARLCLDPDASLPDA